MKASPNQTSFNSGELSKLMQGRVDFDRLRSSMAVCLNSMLHVEGPVTRRPGTYICDEVKDSTRATRTVHFKFSTGQSYAIEFGHRYVRFKKNRAPVYDSSWTVTAVTVGTPTIITYSGSDPSNGDDLDLTGMDGMPALNGKRVRVTNVNAGANTFEAYNLDGTPFNSTGYGTFVANPSATMSRVYTLTTPYDDVDLFQLKFTRSIDKLYIFHVDYPEASLNRFSDANWTHTALVFVDGPYLPTNKTTTTLTPSAFAPGAGVTITASAITGINDDTGFKNTDIGRYIRLREGTTWGYCLITAWTSTTQVTVTIINSLTNTSAKATWRLGLLSNTTGYSACGTFFGDRFYLGGCPYRPSRLDGSKVGDYTNMSETEVDGTVTDANAVSYSLNSEDVQRIRWMKGTANGIAVGTLEGEWLVSPSSLGEAITPTNRNAKQSTPYGSADIDAIQVGTANIFVQTTGRRLREMTYLYYENALQSADLNVLAEHITKGPSAALSGVVELAYQKERIPTVWAPRKDGVLLGATYSKDNKVIGWHRSILGGFSNSVKTAAAVVESCCVIPADDGSYDELWLIVRRYVNGRSVRYHEFLTNIWENGDSQVNAHFLDCGITYNGASTSTIYGLHHLAGETVQVLADGATHPDVVVSDKGVAVLSRNASVVHFGYAYNSDGQLLRFEAGSADGTSQGKIQRSHIVTFRLHDSLGLSVGVSFSKLKLLPFRTAAQNTGEAVPLFSGDKNDFSWPGDYTTENYVCWRWNQPFPGTILSIMPQLETQDR